MQGFLGFLRKISAYQSSGWDTRQDGLQQLAEVGHCGPFRVMDWVTPASAACSGLAKGQATNCVTELRTPS